VPGSATRPGVPRSVARPGRRGPWLPVAVAGHGLCVVAFALLPWANGRGVFADRDFAGPELARLARNADLFIGHPGGGIVAAALAAALYVTPVAAVAAVVVLLGAGWTARPTAAARLAAAAGLLAALAAGGTALLLAAGPGAGTLFQRLPGPGALASPAGALLGAGAALRLAHPPDGA
jgi:hypothetical protein